MGDPITQSSSGSACRRLYLEDFDLAAGRVDVLDVVAPLVGGERVHLDPEGYALLAAVLPGRELGANAVDLQGETPDGVGGGIEVSVWEQGLQGTWMKTEAFLAGSQRNSMVLRCSGCEQGSTMPTDSGISAHSQSVRPPCLGLWV